MRPSIFSLILIFVTGLAGMAQVPDSSRIRKKSPQQYSTDSVISGQEIYNGQKPRKSKSNGDTLSNPRNNSKAGGMKSKTPHSNKK